MILGDLAHVQRGVTATDGGGAGDHVIGTVLVGKIAVREQVSVALALFEVALERLGDGGHVMKKAVFDEGLHLGQQGLVAHHRVHRGHGGHAARLDTPEHLARAVGVHHFSLFHPGLEP